jgi:TolB-like protein/class 3 adenylate cyclase
VERKLTAILAADMVGYSRHVHEAEEAALQLLRGYRAIIDTLIANHRGRIFDSAGDSVLAEFSSPVEAVRCALEIQQAIKAKNAAMTGTQPMQFRIGIHLSDVVVEEQKLKGEGINIAARLEALAEPGGVLISDDVYRQVYHTHQTGFDDLGERRLKNIAKPVRAYRVRAEPLPWWRQHLTSPARRRQAMAAAGILAGLAIFALGSSLFDRLPQPLREAVGLKGDFQPLEASIAVLPLKNISNNANEEYFSDGLTYDLTGELAKHKKLFVIASNSAFTYKNKPAKAQDIGRDLGVVYLLEGTVMRDEGRVRLSAQLVDTRTGRHVWGERFDQEGKDIFEIQDNIIKAVVMNLAVQVDPAEAQQPELAGTQNPAAYDHYLKGRQLFWEYSRDSIAAAKQEWTEAIRLDPNFARAYTWLAYANLQDVQEGWTDDAKKSDAMAMELALKSISLAPDDYYTHWSLASIHVAHKDIAKAAEAYRKALELNPNDADLLNEMADMFSYQGEPDKAIAQIERAKRLNPKYPDYYDWSLGFAYFQKRDYANAVAALEKLADPPNGAYLLLAASKAKLGKPLPPDQIMARLRAKAPDWTPDHLAEHPYVKAEDQQHYFDALTAAGVPVPRKDEH